MKKVTGINPDFADFDELDPDALSAVTEFEDGQISFDELKALVGFETATAIREKCYGADGPESLFDDPESF